MTITLAAWLAATWHRHSSRGSHHRPKPAWLEICVVACGRNSETPGCRIATGKDYTRTSLISASLRSLRKPAIRGVLGARSHLMRPLSVRM